jgi:metal-responsive CopG/Arc/MetJ family transcriptional regulator
LSILPDLAREAERIAKREGTSKSDLFREALRRYIQEQRWMGLRQYGTQQVSKLGVRESELERIIEERK